MGGSFLIGVVSGVVASFIFLWIQKGIIAAKENIESEFSGNWLDEIYSDDSRATVIKRDRFYLKHDKHNHTVKGTIKRISPEDQIYREWECNGVIYDRFIILSFWRIGPQKSNGCIYAKLTRDRRYEGYYLEEHQTGEIDKTPISLIKEVQVSL